MAQQHSPPVLVLAYNRRAVLERTLVRVLAERPSRLYVSVDGPREDRADDARRVGAVRRYVHSVRQSHNLEALFLDTNGGVRQGVLEGVDWFFSREESGVVVEDDVLISPGSLQLAGECLEKFGGRKDVGSISLFNPVPARRQTHPQRSFRYSSIPSSQYWGSWRERWELTHELRLAHEFVEPPDWLFASGSSSLAWWWWRYLESTSWHQLSWEDIWILTHWREGLQAAYTNSNHSIHLGFTEEATQSFERPSWYPLTLENGRVKLGDYRAVEKDARADQWYYNQRFGLSPWKKMKRAIWVRFPQIRHIYLNFRVLLVGRKQAIKRTLGGVAHVK